MSQNIFQRNVKITAGNNTFYLTNCHGDDIGQGDGTMYGWGNISIKKGSISKVIGVFEIECGVDATVYTRRKGNQKHYDVLRKFVTLCTSDDEQEREESSKMNVCSLKGAKHMSPYFDDNLDKVIREIIYKELQDESPICEYELGYNVGDNEYYEMSCIKPIKRKCN